MKFILRIRSLWKDSHTITSIGTLVAINLLLALVAFLKDVFLASYLGTTHHADTLLLAFFIPDMVGSNLFAAALGISCIPMFSSLSVSGQEHRLNRLAGNLSRAFFILTATVGILLVAFRDRVIAITGPGLNPQEALLAQSLMVLLAPIILLYTLASISASVLNVRSWFTVPALHPVLLNGILLSTVLFTYVFKVPQARGVYLIAGSITAASIAGFLFVAFFSYRFRSAKEGFPSASLFDSPSREEKRSDLWSVFKVFIPYLLILTASQGVLLFERALASASGLGSISGLNYAYRLAQFPNWIFVAAISTVVLPVLSKSQSAGRLDDVKAIFAKAFGWMLLVSVPSFILLYGLREPIIALLFQRGAFNATSLAITSEIMKGYAWSIVPQGMTVICLRVFLSFRRMLLPVTAFTVSSGITVLFDLLFIETIGLSTLGIGAALGGLANTAILLMGLKGVLSIDTKVFMKQTLAPCIVLFLQILARCKEFRRHI